MCIRDSPEANFEDMAMDFMDIRKRVFTFPKMGEKAYLVAIPTSSGTGSEVTPLDVYKRQDHRCPNNLELALAKLPVLG